MDKRYFILAHETARNRAFAALRDAPEGYQVIIEPSKRSGAQNRIFHALCGDIARSGIEWAGKKRNTKIFNGKFGSLSHVACGGRKNGGNQFDAAQTSAIRDPIFASSSIEPRPLNGAHRRVR